MNEVNISFAPQATLMLSALSGAPRETHTKTHIMFWDRKNIIWDILLYLPAFFAGSKNLSSLFRKPVFLSAAFWFVGNRHFDKSCR